MVAKLASAARLPILKFPVLSLISFVTSGKWLSLSVLQFYSCKMRMITVCRALAYHEVK